MSESTSLQSALGVNTPIVTNGGGGGGGAPLPASVSITSPTTNGTVSGSEPGAQFPVTGAYSAPGYTNIAVGVSLNGFTYPATVNTTAHTWSATVRAYRAGTNTLWADMTAVFDTIPYGASSSVSFNAALSSTTPVVTVTTPVAGATVQLQEGGATVAVSATTSDQYGPRSLSLSCEGRTVPMSAQSSTVFTANLVLGPMPLGARQFTVTCVDAGNNTGTRAVSLTGVDVAVPHLTVSFPALGANITADATQTVTIPASGTASDLQSGMTGGSASVSWSLSAAGTPSPATPVGGSFANWTAPIPVTGFGSHTIYFWATDSAGNRIASPLAVPITLISSYTPSTLDERLDGRQYLAALMAFAQDQVTVPGSGALTTSQLVNVLRQPLDRISQPLSAAADAGRQAVNQLRVPVELLRAYISSSSVPTAPGASGEAAYLSTAYTALLSALGTSFAELRLARGAVAADRSALATRLGIQLAATRPDELDKMLLDGTGLTEAAMETTFGLRATTAGLDVLRAPVNPLVLGWRVAGLSATWAVQDQLPVAPRTFAALVDPDVVAATDVVAGPSGDAIRSLISSRAAVLTSYAQSLDNARRAAANATAGLAAMLALALPGVNLATLEARENSGSDISADLTTAGLTRTGFRYLLQMSRLAQTGTVTEPEWADAVAVLTAVRKQMLYATWRSQETMVVLSPDLFVPGGPPQQVSPYRLDPRARSDWQALLVARIAQRQALLDAAAAAVAAAEQAALPILRDALLADITAVSPAGSDAGELMTALFQIDIKAGGSLRTTRLGQATESLQSLLFAIRSGGLPTTHPARTWSLTSGRASFDAAWRWMGDLPSWQTAIQAFLFPERHLDPTLLLAHSTPPTPFDTLWASISGSQPFGPADAAAAVAAYQAARRAASASFPVFTYLDPQRSSAHQSSLAQLSATMGASDAASAREVFWAVPLLIAQRLQSAGQHLAALDWYWLLYPYDTAGVPSIYHVINTELSVPPARPNLTFPPGWTSQLNPFALLAGRPAPYTRATLLTVARCHIEFADAEFTAETDESVARARGLYLAAAQLLNSTWLQPLLPTNPGEPALAIPELTTLTNRVQVQLSKLRQGRNIAGLARVQGGVTGLATGTGINQPTPYRFKVLMDRAKQLAAQAEQVEAGYLAALEKYDAKTLQLSDARKALAVAGAQLDLQTARVSEAGDAVAAAQAQKAKADAMAKVYQENIDAPPNGYETALLNGYKDMRTAKDIIAGADMAVAVAQAAAAAGDVIDEIKSFGIVGVASATQLASNVVKSGASLWINNLESQMQANQLMAGIEQRRNEWRIAQAGVQQDALVATAQSKVATDQQTIAIKEQAIAQLQNTQAANTLELLTTQFTNADLYQWMSRTVGEVYRFFLQQATSIGRLAQAQLAFERAEPARTLIQNDYWQSPSELTSGGSQTDRAGLTGAERLAEAIARLDDYAFSTDRRRLNLSQTFSLAQLMPVEFLAFRNTGVLSFATPMSLFDADFPGHYLRLIRQVRMSLVALVPPGRGIRASLSSNGVSRVTTAQGTGFADIVLRHDPAMVALTSPVNTTGVFELDTQSEMLGPFEGSGVATTWQFSLPKAANPFDYASIADVLITIEHTALYDDAYRSQVVGRLNAARARGADCVFSLARDFPDQWYALNNPDPAVGRAVTLSLTTADFPPNLEGLLTGQIAVQLTGASPVPATVVSLIRGAVGGTATTTDGIAGTRRGNAPAWVPLCGSSPVGDWRLSFSAAADPMFNAGLTDILLIISWTGQAPAWPT